MLRDLALVRQAVRLSFLRDSQFDGDWLTSLVHFAVQLGASAIYWYSLMGRFHSLGGWGWPQMVILSAVANLAPLVDLFYLGFRDLPDKVRRGDLDKFLVRPCDPLVALLSENLYIRYPIYQAATALPLLVWGLRALHTRLTVAALLNAVVAFCFGVYVVRLLSGAVTLSVFWMGRIDSLQTLLGSLRSLAGYPVTVYADGLRRVLTYVLPYGLVATYPTLILTGWQPPPAFWLGVVLISAIWWGVFRLTWRAALRRYESFGG